MPEADIEIGLTKPQQAIFDHTSPARFHAITAGRRFGKTQGAALKCIEWAIDGVGPILWGDTVTANLTKYVERYFLPKLKGIPHHWRAQDKQLTICNVDIDFRSAERPENWEGFGYRRIILNEAGIILQDRYLYTNAVLPMMMDFPDAELYALGTPKGKVLKDGTEHPFWTLYRKGLEGDPTHRSMTFDSYANPLLNTEDIRALELEISAMAPEQVAQEIGGQFIDAVTGRAWAFAFDPDKHVRPVKFTPGQPVQIVADFNVEPFCATLWHINSMSAHCFAEIGIMDPSVEEMGNRIRAIIGQTALLELTGDHNGNNRAIGQNSTASIFSKLQNKLRLGPRQLILKPNPTHLQSREDTNFVLANHPDFAIDPSCAEVIADMKLMEAGPNGEIIKGDRANVRRRVDYGDTVRYAVNTYLGGWIKAHSNELSRRGALRRPERLPSDGREPLHRIASQWL